MKIGYLELTGIKKVVVEHKVVWVRHNDRWVKYIEEEIKGGKSELEMHDYLNGMYWSKKLWSEKNKTSNKYKLWVSGDTVNVTRNDDDAVKQKKSKVIEEPKKKSKKVKKTKKSKSKKKSK
jgi:hypothetical protein